MVTSIHHRRLPVHKPGRIALLLFALVCICSLLLSHGAFTAHASTPISVTLDKTSLTLDTGSNPTGILTATVAPWNAPNKDVTWSSADPTVATVDNGVVTAQKAGTTTITVTTVSAGATATATVTVTSPAPADPAQVTSTYNNLGNISYDLVQNNLFSLRLTTQYQGSYLADQVKVKGTYDGLPNDVQILDKVSSFFSQPGVNGPNFDQQVTYSAPIPSPNDPKGLRFPIDSSKSYSFTFHCTPGGSANRMFTIGGYVDVTSTGQITFAEDVTAQRTSCTGLDGSTIPNTTSASLGATIVPDIFRDNAYAQNKGVFATYTAIDANGNATNGTVTSLSNQKNITLHTDISGKGGLDTSFTYPDGYGSMKLGGSIPSSTLATGDGNPAAASHPWQVGETAHLAMTIQLPTQSPTTSQPVNDSLTLAANGTTSPISSGLTGTQFFPIQAVSPSENDVLHNQQLQDQIKNAGFALTPSSALDVGGYNQPRLNPNYVAGADPNDPNNPQYLEYFNPTEGHYNWTLFDQYMAEYKSLGATTVPLIYSSYTQIWNASIPYNGSNLLDSLRSIPADFNKWTEPIVAILNHYNGPDNQGQWPKINQVYVGNENESSQFWKDSVVYNGVRVPATNHGYTTPLNDQQRATLYVQMYEAVYDAIKASDRSIAVIGSDSPCWCTPPTAIEQAFFTYFNDPAHFDPVTNSAKYDGVNFHFYAHGSFGLPPAPDPQTQANGLASAIAAYNSYVSKNNYKQVPIIISEVGYGIGSAYDRPDQVNMNDALFDGYAWTILAQQGISYAANFDLNSDTIGVIDPYTQRAYPPYYALQIFNLYQGVKDGNVAQFTSGTTLTNNSLGLTALPSVQTVGSNKIYQAFLTKKRPYVHSNLTFTVNNLTPGSSYNLVEYRLYDERGTERQTLASNLTADASGSLSYAYTTMPDQGIVLLRLQPTSYQDPYQDFTKPPYTPPASYSAVTANLVTDYADPRNNFYDVEGPKFSFQLYPNMSAPAGPVSDFIERVKLKTSYNGVNYKLNLFDKIQLQMYTPYAPTGPGSNFAYTDTRQPNYLQFRAYAPQTGNGKITFPILARQAGTPGDDQLPSDLTRPIFYITGSLDVYDSGRISLSLNYLNQDAISNYQSIQLRMIPSLDALSNASYGGKFEATYSANQGGNTITGNFSQVGSSQGGLSSLTINNLYNTGISLPITMSNGLYSVEQFSDTTPPLRRVVIGAGELSPTNWTSGQQKTYAVDFTLPQNVEQTQASSQVTLNVGGSTTPVSQDLMYTQISASDVQHLDPNENDILNNRTLQGLLSNGTFSGFRMGIQMSGYNTVVTNPDGSYGDSFNPRPGVYNWATLDSYMALLKKLGINRVGMTFATYTPNWNSTLPYNGTTQTSLVTAARAVPKDFNAWAQMCVDVLNHYSDTTQWPQIVWTDIGNEVYDNRFFNMNGLPPAPSGVSANDYRMQTFTQMYEATYKLIKQSYPNLPVAGGGEWEPNFLQYEASLNPPGTDYDQINIHPYGTFDAHYPDYFNWLVNNTFLPGNKVVPLNLNEFNYDYDNIRAGDELYGMPAALWMAEVYRNLINSGVQYASTFDFASVNLGVVNPHTLTPRPEYYALQLLGKYMGISGGQASSYTSGLTTSGDILTEATTWGNHYDLLTIKPNPAEHNACNLLITGLQPNTSYTVTEYVLADSSTTAPTVKRTYQRTFTTGSDGSLHISNSTLPDYGMAVFDVSH